MEYFHRIIAIRWREEREEKNSKTKHHASSSTLC